MSGRTWLTLCGAALFLGASIFVQHYPDPSAWPTLLACLRDVVYRWQTVIGGTLAAGAVAWVARVTLTAEARRRRADVDAARTQLATVLRFEILGATDVVSRAIWIIEESKKNGGPVRPPPFHLPLPAYTQSMPTLALIGNDLLDKVMRFHNGLWTYHTLADRLDGEVVRKAAPGSRQERARIEFMDWAHDALRIGNHLNTHMMILELGAEPIEWGEDFGNWPAPSNKARAVLDKMPQ